MDFKRKQARSASYVRYLVKKLKETGILIDKPKGKKLLWQKVCVKRHQHQFTAVLNN